MSPFDQAAQFQKLNSVAGDMAFNGRYSGTGYKRIAKDAMLNAQDLETAKQMVGIGGTMAPLMGI